MPSILRAGRPTEQRLLASLAGVRGEALTYEGVGCSLGLARPDPGLEVRTWWTNLPAGSWERAAGALDAWAAHRGAGFVVVPGGPPAVGVEVAVGVPLAAGHLVATCRIVATVDEPDRVGFAYGRAARVAAPGKGDRPLPERHAELGQPLISGPARSMVIRSSTRRSRAMAAR